MRQIFILSLLIYLSSITGQPALSSEQNDDDNAVTSNSNRLRKNTYSMMDADTHSPKMLMIEAEQAFASGELEEAEHKVKQSLNIDNDDMDAHLLYARILNEKLNNQTERDPTLFNKTVEEWVNVMRTRFGDEKRMRWRGINPFGDLYNDEDRSIVAKAALVKLTGRSPHSLETDAHYLKQVEMPSVENVTANVVKKGKNSKNVPIANELQLSK